MEEMNFKLYLKKDFQHLVLHFQGTPYRSVVHTFPKFMIQFVKDVCLFPHVFLQFLQPFVSNQSIYSRVQLSFDNEPWVNDNNSFVPQPYINNDIGPQRLAVISFALQRQYGPGVLDHFFNRASKKQNQNDPASQFERFEEDLNNFRQHSHSHDHGHSHSHGVSDDNYHGQDYDYDYDYGHEHGDDYGHEHEGHESSKYSTQVQDNDSASKMSQISFSDVSPSDSVSVSAVDESALSFECVTPTAASPVVSAGSYDGPLTAEV